MRVAAKVSHYALIPSAKNDPRKSGVSPGRLLQVCVGFAGNFGGFTLLHSIFRFFAKVGSDDAKN